MVWFKKRQERAVPLEHHRPQVQAESGDELGDNSGNRWLRAYEHATCFPVHSSKYRAESLPKIRYGGDDLGNEDSFPFDETPYSLAIPQWQALLQPHQRFAAFIRFLDTYFLTSRKRATDQPAFNPGLFVTFCASSFCRLEFVRQARVPWRQANFTCLHFEIQTLFSRTAPPNGDLPTSRDLDDAKMIAKSIMLTSHNAWLHRTKAYIRIQFVILSNCSGYPPATPPSHRGCQKVATNHDFRFTSLHRLAFVCVF
ncbi:MAG: hypothetical protein ABI273_15730 [Lacunisphaera sp.]